MDKLVQRVERAIAERVFPGCVVGILNDGFSNIHPFGNLTYQTDPILYGRTAPVTKDTVYDVASITKSIPVAALASLFMEEGKLALEDQVKKYVPEIKRDFGATIEDLLRYRVKGPRMSTLQCTTDEEVRAHAIAHGFDGPPGGFEYANFPAFVLGIVLERAGGASIDTLAHQRFFDQLAMSHTTFFPRADDCAPTEIVGGEIIRGLPHDESARIFAKAHRTAGHAGLFSTAGDLLQFAAYLIEYPENAIAGDARRGLGWQTQDLYLFGSKRRPGAFGKSGFTGTSIVIDAEEKRALVLLSNRTYPHRPTDAHAINTLRRDLADIVFVHDHA